MSSKLTRKILIGGKKKTKKVEDAATKKQQAKETKDKSVKEKGGVLGKQKRGSQANLKKSSTKLESPQAKLFKMVEDEIDIKYGNDYRNLQLHGKEKNKKEKKEKKPKEEKHSKEGKPGTLTPKKTAAFLIICVCCSSFAYLSGL
jgi:hypothetical protein